MFNNFFPQYHAVWDNVEKYGRARQATDDNISVIWRVGFTYQITKAGLQCLLLFHGNNWYASTTQCYVYTYTACLARS